MLRIPFESSLMGTDALVVAVLGPGRLGETHLAALARLRERGLVVDGRPVAIVPALYGRNAERARAVAERYGVERISTELDELIDAPDVAVSTTVCRITCTSSH